jgi:hypothetical protein
VPAARRLALEQPLGGRVIAAALAWSFAAWLLYGVQVWLLATQLSVRGSTTAPAGYHRVCVRLERGLPGRAGPTGAGIRNVLLVAVLGPVLGASGATAVALVSRILTIVGDLAAAGGSGPVGSPPPLTTRGE